MRICRNDRTADDKPDSAPVKASVPVGNGSEPNSDSAADCVLRSIHAVAAAGGDPLRTTAHAIGRYMREFDDVASAVEDNGDRGPADWAESMMDVYTAITHNGAMFSDTDPDDNLSDATADLLHLARRCGCDPEAIIRRGCGYFDDEEAEMSQNDTADNSE